MVGQVAVLTKGAPHILWIERIEAPLVVIEHQRFVCQRMHFSKTIVGRFPQMDASTRQGLTKRIGTNVGSDRKLVPSLIIVTDPVKCRALHAILAEIGAVVSSDC